MKHRYFHHHLFWIIFKLSLLVNLTPKGSSIGKLGACMMERIMMAVEGNRSLALL